MVFPLVPAYFAIVWDAHCPAVLKGDLLGEHSLERWYDFIFHFFSVHKCQRVVVLHHQEARALAPDAEHCAVYDVG